MSGEISAEGRFRAGQAPGRGWGCGAPRGRCAPRSSAQRTTQVARLRGLTRYATMSAAGKKTKLKRKKRMKLWPFRPATLAGQNAMAIQMTSPRRDHNHHALAASNTWISLIGKNAAPRACCVPASWLGRTTYPRKSTGCLAHAPREGRLSGVQAPSITAVGGGSLRTRDFLPDDATEAEVAR